MHQHIFHFDDVHGAVSHGVCSCGEERDGRNYLTLAEVDKLEIRQGIVVDMPKRRGICSMAEAVKKTLGVNPVPRPLPIELSCDAMIVKALYIAMPRSLISNGHQVDSLEISGDAALVSQIALAFKAGQLSILVNLS